MATPKQNYARQYQAYAQSIEPDIPSSVRTYSIFNPDTGTWQRMTNNFRSPIPAQGQTLIPTQTPGIMLRPRTQVLPMTPEQEQAAIEAGLARARATQGTTYQPLPQVPAQRPSGGSRRRSPASGGGTVVVPVDQAQGVPQTASKRGFDVAPLGETESEKLKLAPRPVDRFLATVSPDNQTPVYLPIPKALPTVQINVPNPNINTNKEKPFGLKSSSEIKAELEAEEKADLQADVRKYRRVTKALNEGTYSPIKELLGLYGWAAEHNRNFIPELPDFDY